MDRYLSCCCARGIVRRLGPVLQYELSTPHDTVCSVCPLCGHQQEIESTCISIAFSQRFFRRPDNFHSQVINFRDFDINDARKWFPISFLLVSVIYTGSKSLVSLNLNLGSSAIT